ncbi:MAG: hypothetical protein IJC19_00765, partial [Clostridia bacterium]|nr:hypothetical protein [Clostridia bacterium]
PNSEIYARAKAEGKFCYPDTIKGVAMEVEQRATDKIIVNLSDVPDVELKVVHHYFQWKAFASKPTAWGIWYRTF